MDSDSDVRVVSLDHGSVLFERQKIIFGLSSPSWFHARRVYS